MILYGGQQMNNNVTCKCCGLTLDVKAQAKEIVCPYCGTSYQVLGQREKKENKNYSTATATKYKIMSNPVVEIINYGNRFQNMPFVSEWDRPIGYFQGRYIKEFYMPYAKCPEILDTQICFYLAVSYLTGTPYRLVFRMACDGCRRSFLDKKDVLRRSERNLDSLLFNSAFREDFLRKELLFRLDDKSEPLFSRDEEKIMADFENHLIRKYGFKFTTESRQVFDDVTTVQGKPGFLKSSAPVYNHYICHFYNMRIGSLEATPKLGLQVLNNQMKSYLDKLSENDIVNQIADAFCQLAVNINSSEKSTYYNGLQGIEVTPRSVKWGHVKYDDEYEKTYFYPTSISCQQSFGKDCFYFNENFGMKEIDDEPLRYSFWAVLASKVLTRLRDKNIYYHMNRMISTLYGDFVLLLAPSVICVDTYRDWI